MLSVQQPGMGQDFASRTLNCQVSSRRLSCPAPLGSLHDATKLEAHLTFACQEEVAMQINNADQQRTDLLAPYNGGPTRLKPSDLKQDPPLGNMY